MLNMSVMYNSDGEVCERGCNYPEYAFTPVGEGNEMMMLALGFIRAYPMLGLTLRKRFITNV